MNPLNLPGVIWDAERKRLTVPLPLPLSQIADVHDFAAKHIDPRNTIAITDIHPRTLYLCRDADADAWRAELRSLA